MSRHKIATIPLVVTGASGRIGRMLRAVWGEMGAGRPVIWSARRPGDGIDLAWDIGQGAVPDLPGGAIFLHLAGKTVGDAEALAGNSRSAEILCEAARRSEARHVLLISSVAVYCPQADPISEDRAPDPVSPYGRAKLETERSARAAGADLTVLRLANLAGADMLLTAARSSPVLLDPIDGQAGGPERSYIGPHVLAAVLARLVDLLAEGRPLPPVLNLAQAPALAMADLLIAAGAEWRFGPPRTEAIPRVAVAVDRLAALVDLPRATARSVVDDLDRLKGRWPC